MNPSTNFIKVMRRELKRRKVVRACVIYVTASWGGYLVLEKVLDTLGLKPDAVELGKKAFSLLGFAPGNEWEGMLAIAILGLPIAAIFSWFYQVSARGIIRTPSFVERRILNNLAPLDDRRMEPPLPPRKPSKHESAYDWILEMESGPLLGLRYGVDEDIMVGRSLACEVTIPVDLISRKHAQFILNGSELLVKDLGSANGTSVKGTKIDGAFNLNHQDTVEIFDVIIRIKESLAHNLAHAPVRTKNLSAIRNYKIDNLQT